MKTLGILSRKGGAGKTTLALHLAVMAQLSGRRTVLVDLDPQRSAAAWWRAREASTPLLVESEPDKLAGLIEAGAADGVDLAVIDTAPNSGPEAVHVAALADLVLIPVRPAILDLRSVLGTLDIVKGSARRALIALNACPPPRGAGEASVTGDARRALAAFGVPVAAVAIINRTAFSASLIGGLTACEAAPDGKAAREMRALWRIIERELDR